MGAFIVGQQGDLVVASQMAGPLIADPRLANILAIAGRPDKQDFQHVFMISIPER
jgi:hypothetical protein